VPPQTDQSNRTAKKQYKKKEWQLSFINIKMPDRSWSSLSYFFGCRCFGGVRRALAVLRGADEDEEGRIVWTVTFLAGRRSGQKGRCFSNGTVDLVVVMGILAKTGVGRTIDLAADD
jgi:hypothetical protein